MVLVVTWWYCLTCVHYFRQLTLPSSFSFHFFNTYLVSVVRNLMELTFFISARPYAIFLLECADRVPATVVPRVAVAHQEARACTVACPVLTIFVAYVCLSWMLASFRVLCFDMASHIL